MGSTDRGVVLVATCVRAVALLLCVLFAVGWLIFWVSELRSGTMNALFAVLIMTTGSAGNALTITSLLLFRGTPLHGVVLEVFLFWFLHTVAATCLPLSKPNPAAFVTIECNHCQYDIRGLEATTCPECGNHLNRRGTSVKGS